MSAPQKLQCDCTTVSISLLYQIHLPYFRQPYLTVTVRAVCVNRQWDECLIVQFQWWHVCLTLRGHLSNPKVSTTWGPSRPQAHFSTINEEESTRVRSENNNRTPHFARTKAKRNGLSSTTVLFYFIIFLLSSREDSKQERQMIFWRSGQHALSQFEQQVNTFVSRTLGQRWHRFLKPACDTTAVESTTRNPRLCIASRTFSCSATRFWRSRLKC